MNNTVITAIVVAVVFGGGGYYLGSQKASSAAITQSPTGATGNFGGRGGNRFGAGGGFTGGTILSIGNGSLTIQLPSSTSTTATTGTKIVLFDTTTQVSEMQSVPASKLTVGQNVMVTGSLNSDGSVTATSIQVRPARTGGPERPATTPTTGQ
jgi:hypothetical protein